MANPDSIEHPEEQNYIITFEDDIPSEIVFDDHTIKLLAPEEQRPNIPAEDYEEAFQQYQQLLKDGFMPVITIPNEFRETIKKNGILPHETYIPTLKNISGTIGVPPYKPEGRLLAIIKNPKIAEKLHFRPRFTGKGKRFQGVISTLNGIPSEDFILITPEEFEYFREEQQKSTKVSGIRKKIKRQFKKAL